MGWFLGTHIQFWHSKTLGGLSLGLGPATVSFLSSRRKEAREPTYSVLDTTGYNSADCLPSPLTGGRISHKSCCPTKLNLKQNLLGFGSQDQVEEELGLQHYQQ